MSKYVLFAPSHTYTNGGPLARVMSQNLFSGDTESINDAVKEAKDFREANVAIVRITGRGTRTVLRTQGETINGPQVVEIGYDEVQSYALCTGYPVAVFDSIVDAHLASTFMRDYDPRCFPVLLDEVPDLVSGTFVATAITMMDKITQVAASIVSDETDDEDIVILDKPELLGAHGASNLVIVRCVAKTDRSVWVVPVALWSESEWYEGKSPEAIAEYIARDDDATKEMFPEGETITVTVSSLETDSHYDEYEDDYDEYEDDDDDAGDTVVAAVVPGPVQPTAEQPAKTTEKLVEEISDLLAGVIAQYLLGK